MEGKPEFEEIAKVGRTFRGVMRPTGPSGEWKTVLMYVAVAQQTEHYGDEGIVTPECTSLVELKEAIQKLKSDLAWVCQGLEGKMRAAGS